MAWQPNRKQWALIFCTAIVSLSLWGGAAAERYRGDREQQERWAISVVVIGGLLVWYLSEKRT